MTVLMTALAVLTTRRALKQAAVSVREAEAVSVREAEASRGLRQAWASV